MDAKPRRIANTAKPISGGKVTRMGSVRANRSSAPENDAGVCDIGLDGSVGRP